MRALILDDDDQIARFLQDLIHKFFPVFTEVTCVNTTKELVTVMNEQRFDLLLLDVELGGGETSFDYLDTLPLGNAKIIFVTGHPDYAIPAIKNNALDYVLKPIQLADFKAAVNKALKMIEEEDTVTLSEIQERQHHRITIHELEQIQFLPLNEIEAFEANGAYTNITLMNGESIVSSKHLKYYEDLVANSGFYRVHNSFVINILRISSVNKRDGVSVILKSGKEVMISVRRKEDFLNYVTKYISLN